MSLFTTLGIPCVEKMRHSFEMVDFAAVDETTSTSGNQLEHTLLLETGHRNQCGLYAKALEEAVTSSSGQVDLPECWFGMLGNS